VHRDEQLFLHVLWSAWRECIQDSRVLQVKELKQKLAELEAAGETLKAIHATIDERLKQVAEEPLEEEEEPEEPARSEVPSQGAESSLSSPPRSIKSIGTSLLVNPDARVLKGTPDHGRSWLSRLCSCLQPATRAHFFSRRDPVVKPLLEPDIGQDPAHHRDSTEATPTGAPTPPNSEATSPRMPAPPNSEDTSPKMPASPRVPLPHPFHSSGNTLPAACAP